MQRIVPFGVTVDPSGTQPVLLLKTTDADRFLPLSIGHGEAIAILSELDGRASPRPMTHDLMVRMLADLDAEITRVTVTEVRDRVFHALLTVRRGDTEREFDSRPSDALALAVRVGAPMYAADAVIEERAVAADLGEGADESVIEDFRRFLDDVSPEQFGSR